MNEIKWIKVWECITPEEVYVLKAYLENQGIRVVLQGVEEKGLFPSIGFSRVPVLVLEEDKEKAEKLIEQYRSKNEAE